MSLGYAERLSYREDLGGRLGDPEQADSSNEVLDKAEKLAELIRSANRVIAFTGAGISTACGIPDFRGPNGVWTMQRKGLPLPKAKTSFVFAQPSLTHMALLGLMQSGKLQYICSQNVDSLHVRSGVPRSQIAELHGNCFAERCKKCKTEYVRDFEMDTVGFKPTGRMCTKPGCKGHLVDHILDWEDALPPAELKATEQHGSAADVAICLGTSLQIIPAANLPLRTVKAGGSLAIINLQDTPKDKKAALVIHGKVDEVMATVMHRLGTPIPQYIRTDKVMLTHKATPAQQQDNSPSKPQMHRLQQHEQQQPSLQSWGNEEVEQPQQYQQQQQQEQLGPESHAGLSNTQQASMCGSNNSGSSWAFTFSISSVHGEQCPLPMVVSARVSFYGRPHYSTPGGTAAPPAPPAAAVGCSDEPTAATTTTSAAAAEPGPLSLEGLQEVLPAQELSGGLPWRVQHTCSGQLQQVVVVLQLQLADAADADKRSHQVHYLINQPSPQPPTTTDKNRGTRGATAKQRQQQQQPDHYQTISFITQVRDYGAEQQQLVGQLAAAAATTQPPPPQAAATNGRTSKGKPSKSSQARSSKGSSALLGDADDDAEPLLASKAGSDSGSDSASYGDGDDGSQDSDFELGEEATGQQGKNSSGRPRKRTKRLNL